EHVAHGLRVIDGQDTLGHCGIIRLLLPGGICLRRDFAVRHGFVDTLSLSIYRRRGLAITRQAISTAVFNHAFKLIGERVLKPFGMLQIARRDRLLIAWPAQTEIDESLDEGLRRPPDRQLTM